MSANETTEPTKISFREAYDELKAVTDRLNGEEVEPDQLVDLLRRGKGLEVALRRQLTEIEQEVSSIEKGEGIAAYEIVPGEARTVDPSGDVPADTSGFEATGGSSDDIPF